MGSLFRTLSARFGRQADRLERQRAASASGKAPPRVDPKRQVSCKIILLDGTDLNVVVSKKALASEVFDHVFYSLDIEERDYFGLQFTDHYHVHHWLDPAKKLVKQVPIGPPFTFRFRVKFFTADPSNLREEITKYQFFLHIKNDIASGRLACPRDAAVDLAAFALQSELGDCNPVEHTPLLVSEFRFHPEQDEQMDIDIYERFKGCRGQTPAQAEMNYLNRARWIEMYGVDMHVVEGKDGNQYSLGLTPQGMLVFDGSQKIGLFFWEKIQKLDFRNKKLTLVVEEDADATKPGEVQLHTFVFNLSSHKACKHLWKCGVEHHSFFRLKVRDVRVNERRSRSELFRLGSTFRFRGRTEYENLHKEGRVPRRSSTFERRPSQRYGPRQSDQRRDDRRDGRTEHRKEVKQHVASAIISPPMVPSLPSSSLPSSTVSSSSHSFPSSFAPSSHADKVAAAECRLDKLIVAGPSSTLNSRIPKSEVAPLSSEPRRLSPHVTSIPVGPVSSPEKTVVSTEAKNSKIPKYVVSPMQSTSGSEASSPTPLLPPSSPTLSPSNIPVLTPPSSLTSPSSGNIPTTLITSSSNPPSGPTNIPSMTTSSSHIPVMSSSPSNIPTLKSPTRSSPTNIPTPTGLPSLTTPSSLANPSMTSSSPSPPPPSNIPRLTKSKLPLAKESSPPASEEPSLMAAPQSRIPKMNSGSGIPCSAFNSNLRMPSSRVTTQL